MNGLNQFDIALTSFYDMRHIERDFFLCKGLTDRGYRVFVFTDSSDNDAYFKSKNIYSVNVSEEVKKVVLNEDINSVINSIKLKYNIPRSIYKFVETSYLQNKRIYKSRDHAVVYAVKLFLAYERIFETIRVNCFFQLYTADIDRMVLWYAAKFYCKNVFSYTASGFPQKELILVENEEFKVAGLKGGFSRLKQHDRELIEKIRGTILSLKKENKYLVPPTFSLRNKLKKLPYVKNLLKKSDKKLLLKDLCVDLVVKPWRKKMTRSFYQMPDETEKYIFYPIHAPLEDQVIVRGFPYRNEFELIKSIALSIPYGYKLYIKEHPGYEGFYPVRMFRELSDFGNIKILPPRMNSHEVIRKAALCIVINSTVWFEALLLKVPVISLGEGFFTGFGVCKEIDDLGKLDQAIEETLNSPLDNDNIDRFLHALYAVSHKHVFRYYLSQVPETAGTELAELVHTFISTRTA